MSDCVHLSDSAYDLINAREVVDVLFRATSDLAVLLDTDHSIVAANEAMARSLGFSLKALLDFTPSQHLPPEVIVSRSGHVDEVIRTGQPADFNDTRDGRTFVNRIHPIRDKTGSVSHVAVFSRDVSADLQKDTDLSQSERRYQALIENLPMGIFYKDLSAAYMTCNSKFALDLHLTQEEIIGKTDHDLFPPDIAERYQAEDCRILEEGKTLEIEESDWRNPDPSDGVMWTVKTPVRNDLNVVIGILGIYWDITERKRAERQQKRLSEMQKRMTTLVAHDLKTPLTAIAGYADLLERAAQAAVPPNRMDPDILAGMRRNVHRLGWLIDTFLDLEQIESRSLAQPKAHFPAKDFLDALALQHSFLVRKKGLTLDVEVADMLSIYGDANMLSRVFSNILSNAIRFTDAGRIRIVATATESGIVVQTSDTGRGIDPSDLAHIFEQFYHADPESPESSSSGHGVGLTLAKSILEDYGDLIEVRSEVGEGTTVTVTLPHAPSAEAAEPPV